MKKTIILTALLLALLFAFSSASALTAVTTIYPQYDFLRTIGGERIDVTMLIKPGAEVHSYEPTPKDVLSIAACDLFVYGGGESDTWVEGILESSGTKASVFAMMDCVPLLEEEEFDEKEEEEAHHHEEAEYDEHVWTSPKNALLIVQALCDTLCELDPEGSDVYKANTADYLDQLTELDEALTQVCTESELHTLVFADRFPLLYFVKDYGLDYAAAFPGCSSETEPSAATLTRLIETVIDEKLPAVFRLETSNDSIAKTVSDASGADILVYHDCHNITADDFASGKTYLEYMWENVESLKTALNYSEK